MITGPTMLTPNGSGSGAGACCSSSWKMYCFTALQPVPPHATGQCGTAQPLALRMRCQVTMSCFSSRRASTILRRVGAGKAARMNARTSSRNAISSGVKRRSMVRPFLVGPRASRPLFGAMRARGARSQLSVHLEQSRRPHAAADAHGDDGAPGAAAPSFDQDMAGHTRSAHAKGMADRDRAAVDIETFLGDTKAIAAVEHLAGKGLVELPQIDIVDIEALARQQLGNGEHRADAHLVGFAACDREAPECAKRLQPALFSELRVHQHAGGGAVGELARIAGGDEAAVAHRRKRCEAFEGGVGAVAFIALEGDG